MDLHKVVHISRKPLSLGHLTQGAASPLPSIHTPPPQLFPPKRPVGSLSANPKAFQRLCHVALLAIICHWDTLKQYLFLLCIIKL